MIDKICTDLNIEVSRADYLVSQVYKYTGLFRIPLKLAIDSGFAIIDHVKKCNKALLDFRLSDEEAISNIIPAMSNLDIITIYPDIECIKTAINSRGSSKRPKIFTYLTDNQLVYGRRISGNDIISVAREFYDLVDGIIVSANSVSNIKNTTKFRSVFAFCGNQPPGEAIAAGANVVILDVADDPDPVAALSGHSCDIEYSLKV